MDMIAMLLSWILSWKKLGALNDFKHGSQILMFQKMYFGSSAEENWRV